VIREIGLADVAGLLNPRDGQVKPPGGIPVFIRNAGRPMQSHAAVGRPDTDSKPGGIGAESFYISFGAMRAIETEAFDMPDTHVIPAAPH